MSEGPQQVEPAAPGHDQVGDDERGKEGRSFPQRLLDVSGLANLVAEVRQQRHETLPRRPVVVDDENAMGHCRALRDRNSR